MNAQIPVSQKAKIVSGGRLQIPAELRQLLEIKDGDYVVLAVEEGQLIVRPYREVLRRIRARVREYIPEDVSLSDELIADRHAESERE